MSTKTTNFEFVKPDMTDPADISALNENWDKVDEKLGQTYVQSYTRLSQFGLSDNEMSPTDFTSNIDKIVTTLNGNAANLMLILDTVIHPNLHASVIQKLNADTSITFSASVHVGWLSIRFFGEMYRPVLIETNLETAKYYDSVWTCVYNKGASGNEMSAFKTTANVSVPLVVQTQMSLDAMSNRVYLGELPFGKTLRDIYMIQIPQKGDETTLSPCNSTLMLFGNYYINGCSYMSMMYIFGTNISHGSVKLSLTPTSYGVDIITTDWYINSFDIATGKTSTTWQTPKDNCVIFFK